ncbi:MAG: 50S ribosomal protein L4 [Candidatus Parcubacteria bacterium]|nr:MAG: 50S ribosomal protein L4 [Candidatus Parcubacteria bacterium]
MKLKVYNQDGQEIREIEVNDVFDKIKFNPSLVHQVMRWQLLNNYFPWAHTKTRGEVRGGGRKPWRQKGTGRARHGSIRSPIWRGGGVVFGPRKEKIRFLRINKKMKRKAILMVLVEKMKKNYVKVLDSLAPQELKTKFMDRILRNFLEKRKTNKKRESALVIITDNNKNLIKIIRNLPYADAIEARNLNILSLLNHKYIFLEPESIEIIKKTFLK